MENAWRGCGKGVEIHRNAAAIGSRREEVCHAGNQLGL
jgi:hypothetical protein